MSMKMLLSGGLLVTSLSVVAGSIAFAQKSTPKPKPLPYAQEQTKWRQDQEKDLKSENGWLTVAGLFWLQEGDNSAGADPKCRIVFPQGTAPEDVGKVTLKNGHATLTVSKGVEVKVNGKPVELVEMKSDEKGKPDKAVLGRLTFTVIKRGKRMGIRLYDPQAKTFTGFTGEKWFPVSTKYRIKAKFTAYKPVRQIPITNVLGDTSMNPCPGYVTFKVDGRKCSLNALDSGDVLFFNFADLTSGNTTYPAGRFMDAPKPDKQGFVLLDFNQATNPPCAFTAFATCPLPPKGNRLKVAIPAGEKLYKPTEE